MFYENIFGRGHGCGYRRGHDFFSSRHGRFGGREGFMGRFGAGWMGGPGMRAARILASGDLRLIILALLSEKPRHGYEIIKALEEHSSGIYTPSPGMVYPALTYLEEMGYAAVEADGSKKLYRITEAGTAFLAEHRKSADETLEQLARFGRKMAHWRRRFAEEDEENEEFRDDQRESDRSEWHRVKAEFRDLRDDLRSALRATIDASLEERKRIMAILRRALDEIRGAKPGGAN